MQEKGIEEGAELSHVTSALLYNYMILEKYDSSDELEEEAAIKAIAEEYGLAEDQLCIIYSDTMGTKELIVIYDRESLVVEEMIARKQVVSNTEE